MYCTVCRQEEDKDNDVQAFNLYVEGSEGTNLCFTCEMKVVEFIRALKLVAGMGYMRGRKDRDKSKKEG